MTKDQILWQKFTRGDQEALTSIYFEHAESMIQYGRKYTSCQEIIEDSIQDVFLTLIKTRKHICTPTNARFYLLKSFRNSLIKELQRCSKVKQMDSYIENSFSVTFNIELDLSREQISKQRIKLLNNLLESLSPRQREAIYLRYKMGMSHDEISMMMNVSDQVSRNLTSQAIKRMKEQLDLLKLDIESFVFLLI